MSVTSLSFFCFFGLSLLIYYVIPKKTQWFFLLILSCFFFWRTSASETVWYLIAAIIVTTTSARGIHKALTVGKDRNARIFLAIGLFINIVMLALLKYANFFIDNVNRFSFGRFHLSFLQLAAPIGISFYTLQLVGYLLDVYWGIVEYQPSFLKTALFAAYYPQLTSGPISRYSQLKDQLYVGHQFSWKNVTFGLQRMMWGIFKKLVVSERAGMIVDTIYGDTATYDGLYIVWAAVLFMMQLYADFSGCMDIIIGASECYGIMLPENFRTPFFSRSVQEYWQRWHITLGAWLKDYVMFPILRSNTWRGLTKNVKRLFGKKAAKQIPAYLGMLCVWLLIGLWHGGAWKYVIGEGLWFWCVIVLEQLFAPVSKKVTKRLSINTDAFSWHVFQSLRVFICVCIGNIFFRLGSLKEAFAVIKLIFQHWNPEIFFCAGLSHPGIGRKNYVVLLIGLLVMLVVSALQEEKSVRERLAEQNLIFRWFILLMLLFSTIIFGIWGPGFSVSSFIYEAF